MSRATNLILQITFRWENLSLNDHSSVLQAIQSHVIQNKLWSDLGTRVQYKSCTASDSHASSLSFSLQSGICNDSIDIRDIGLPVQTSIVYVQAINVELLLSPIEHSTESSQATKKSGIFKESRFEDNRHNSIEYACVPLITEALQFFFQPGFGTGSKYIRQRMFQAPRLSDLAPGVFVPEFSRDMHARQKLVAPLSRILAEFQGAPYANPSEQSISDKQKNQGFRIAKSEENLWNCMIHTLRHSRKAVHHNQVASNQEITNLSIGDTQKCNAEERNMKSQSSVSQILLKPVQALDLTMVPSEGLQDRAILGSRATITSSNSFASEYQPAMLLDPESKMLPALSRSNTPFSCDLFGWSDVEPDLPQHVVEDILLRSDISDGETGADTLLLDAEMDFCHTRGEGSISRGVEESPYTPNQQFAYFDPGMCTWDPFIKQDDKDLISGDLMTHDSSYAYSSYNNDFRATQGEHYILPNPPIPSLPLDAESTLINEHNHHRFSSTLNEHDSMSEDLQGASPKSYLTLDTTRFSTVDSQQRRESVTPCCTGNYSLSKSRSSPYKTGAAYERPPSGAVPTSNQNPSSIRNIRSQTSDEMLFDSFDSDRGAPGSSGRSRADKDEIVFDSQSRRSTAPSSTASSPYVQPQRKSSVLKELRIGSETGSVSDNEMLFQQSSPTRDIDMKGRKVLEEFL